MIFRYQKDNKFQTVSPPSQGKCTSLRLEINHEKKILAFWVYFLGRKHGLNSDFETFKGTKLRNQDIKEDIKLTHFTIFNKVYVKRNNTTKVEYIDVVFNSDLKVAERIHPLDRAG